MFNRFFLSVILFFVFTVPHYSQDSSHKMNLIHYLRTQYLGKKISVKDDISGRPFSSKIRNVSFEDDRFLIHLDRNVKLRCSFFTSSLKRQVDVQRDGKQMMLNLQSLKTQEAINNVLKNTGKDSQLGFSSSSIKNLEKNMDMYSKKNIFTTTNKIIYTDHISNKELMDFFNCLKF